MKTQTLFNTLFSLLFSLVLIAQKAEQPDWSYNIGGKINEMYLTEAGTLVVASNDGLVGIKPGSNELLFKFTDYGRVKPEELTFIPASPYVMVAQGGFMSSKKTVIDFVSGQVLFSSEGNQWKQIFTSSTAMPQNKLIVSGLQKTGGMAENNTPKVAVYDLGTGKEDYSFYLFPPGKTTMKSYLVTGDPLLLKDQMLIPTSQGIIAKTLTGETLWENKIKNVNWMTSDISEKEIYAFESNTSGSSMEIYKIGANGAELWKDAAKVKGQVVNFEILPQGLAVVSNKSSGGSNSILAAKDESEIGFLSAQTGEDLWEKAPKTKGYVQHFYIMDDGILFGIQQGGINKISFDGKTLFKKPLKTGENIMVMAHTTQGLIYITSEDANIVNLETGDQVWTKPLKYKRATSVSSTFDKNNNRYLISADDEIMAVDPTTGDVSNFAKTNFDEKEMPNTIEMRNGGIFLGSDQNMTVLDFNGSETYHQYFKSPSKSTFAKIVGGVIAVASTAMAVSAAAAAGANRNSLGDYNSYGKEYDRQSKMFSAIGSASFEFMSQRFKATAATQNAQFILTKLDDGVGLVKVNKDTGKTEKEIILKDKKPEYEVDDFGGILYYKAKDDLIYAYDLKK
ncbi:MAG: PQQ-binding-like beta-propeller repeat protein [Flavobacteriaceae bacterium]|nr:PQQ-binding-like beta-propeller repeat protein [Flavobacteriaceae bacterium]